MLPYPCSSFFFFNDTATTEIYTLSLHDALPILTGLLANATYVWKACIRINSPTATPDFKMTWQVPATSDRKSTRLNSSHQIISYAVFCLKKKKKIKIPYKKRLLYDYLHIAPSIV